MPLPVAMDPSSERRSPALENSDHLSDDLSPAHKASSTSTPKLPPLKSRSTVLSRQLGNMRQKTKVMFIPPRPVGKPPSPLESIKTVITASYLNILLVFIPLSWALHFALPHSFANRDTIIFVASFLAIIPLAKLLAFATEELSLRVGQTLAGLLNATLGNAVELIVAILALIKCELRVVQSSLVGSILSNLLLVLGMCFFAGGLKYSEQGFGVSATQLNSSLLTISVIAVLLPAAFHVSTNSSATDGPAILAVSHGVAIILLFVYAAYLFFQLYSHPDLYDDKGGHSIVTTKYAEPKFRIPKGVTDRMHLHHHKHDQDVEAGTFDSDRPMVQSPQSHSQINGSIDPAQLETVETAESSNISGSFMRNRTIGFQSPDIVREDEKEQDHEEIPMMSLGMTIGLLITVTVTVAITAEWLVDSIDGMTNTGHISKEFVGIILLPIVGNAAEHVTAVSVSVKDKLNLSLGVAVGSSIQIALFVIPFIITLAWILGKPLTLLFDPYESIAMFLSVLTVNYVVQDGKSNWLEGFILMCLYIILALTFWYYPGSDPSGLFQTCH